MKNGREFRKFMREVLYYPMWNDVEVDTWREACEYAGIQYGDYCDPNELFADMCGAQMNKDKKTHGHHTAAATTKIKEDLKMRRLNDIEVGTWVMDTTGIYEVTDINEKVQAAYTLNEVLDDKDEIWIVTDNQRFLTKAEMELMDFIG